MDQASWVAWWESVGASQLRALLNTAWDPIDVYAAGGWVDEYDQYLWRIAGGLRLGFDGTEVAHELAEYRTKRMGLPSNQDHDRAAADAIISWYQRSTDDWERNADATLAR